MELKSGFDNNQHYCTAIHKALIHTYFSLDLIKH